MKKSFWLIIIPFLSIVVVNGAQSLPPEENNDKCFTCHQQEEILPEDFNEDDVHLKIGLTCADCHGGDPTSDDEEIAMSPSKGFVGTPEYNETPEFCGKCHSDINFMRKYNPRMETDQVDQYYTSLHGIELRKGNEDVAQCISCHTAHSILPAKDPRSTVYALNVPKTCNQCHGNSELMSKYNLTADAYEKYAKGVHGIALLKNKDTGSPACNDCHGNHGAIPPGVTSIAYVCGECHVNNMNFFKNSDMGKAFVEKDYHGCVECHGNHEIEPSSDDFVGTSEKAYCINCHKEGDKGFEVAEIIHEEITSLAAIYDSTQVKLEEVRRKGMNDLDIEYIMKDIKQNLIQSRTAVHTFDPEKVKEKTTEGKKYGEEAIAKANAEISEYYTRRNGFAAATLLITLFIIGLYLKIKDMSKKKTIKKT